jgi:hypothetical protein
MCAICDLDSAKSSVTDTGARRRASLAKSFMTRAMSCGFA